MATPPSVPRHHYWTVTAAVLSGIAVSVESLSRICAGTFFDPLPDIPSLVGYTSLIPILLFGSWVLRKVGSGNEPVRGPRGKFLPRTDIRRLVAAATLANGLGVGISVLYCFLFLPTLLPSVFALMVAGVGACAWSPYLNLIALVLQAKELAGQRKRLGVAPVPLNAVAAALGIGAAVVILVPPALVGVTMQRALTDPERRETYVEQLRWLRGEEYVHDFCYQDRSSPWVAFGRALAGGPWSFVTLGLFDNWSLDDVSFAEKRALYFQITGRPHSSRRPSHRVRRLEFSDVRTEQWEEQGGELVGTGIQGLALTTSRIDGVLDPRSETAYCEWTLVFRNTSPRDQEARAEVLLPQGAVVDKASLWINGEERPAAFGGTSQVRTAYRSVAVVQRRDPLLVTQRHPGRVMLQCFPVQPQKTMQIRIGMTAPLLWEPGSNPYLALTPPSLQEVNFQLPRDLKHQIWFTGAWPDGTGRLQGTRWETATSTSPTEVPRPLTFQFGPGKTETVAVTPIPTPANPVHTARLEGTSGDVLNPPSLSITGTGSPAVGQRPRKEWTRVSHPIQPPRGEVHFLTILDRSYGMGSSFTSEDQSALLQALAAIPGARVQVYSARARALGRGGPGTRWFTPQEAGPYLSRIAAEPASGGIDPEAALAPAWRIAAASGRPTAILWIHAPTPATLDENWNLDQEVERGAASQGRIVLVGLQWRPGPDGAMEHLSRYTPVLMEHRHEGRPNLARAVNVAARALTPPPAGLPPEVYPLGGRHPAINGLYGFSGASTKSAGKLTTRPARLLLNSRVVEHWYRRLPFGTQTRGLQKLAIGHRLVTPFTGAVVLETQQQYQEHGLNDKVNEDAIPSVPEPGTLALLLTAGTAGGIAALRRRRRGTGGSSRLSPPSQGESGVGPPAA
ncbi:MAG: PEP-CTERM sorting domain-containing protein [Armatimonadetes bacterium]|nr:PEP-CTERM sorting domain-containing protein [Armatimonadota bacterium]